MAQPRTALFFSLSSPEEEGAEVRLVVSQIIKSPTPTLSLLRRRGGS